MAKAKVGAKARERDNPAPELALHLFPIRSLPSVDAGSHCTLASILYIRPVL